MSRQYGRTMAFDTKTRKDNIQIHGRKIDKFTVQFVSWSLVRTFPTGGTCGFSSVLKWLAVPLPLHLPQQRMVFWNCFLHVCMFCHHLRHTIGTHKVAFACCVRRGCKITRRKCTCICWGFACMWIVCRFNSERAWVKFCLAQHLWKRGRYRWAANW